MGFGKKRHKFKYDHYIRDEIGKSRIKEIKYSDVYHYYLYLLQEKGYALATIEGVHSLLGALFKLVYAQQLITTDIY